MSAVRIAPNVWWVGAIDYAVRDFHGYKTPFGTTYNAYLVVDGKVTLIDTVKHDFALEMISNIAEVADHIH
jgi:flavorubredoxin